MIGLLEKYRKLGSVCLRVSGFRTYRGVRKVFICAFVRLVRLCVVLVGVLGLLVFGEGDALLFF